MNLEQYLAVPESKYAVILAAAYAADPVAQAISASPRQFDLNGVSYVILSLDPAQIRQLYTYVTGSGNAIEFGFVQGTGAIKLLTHHQALDLMAQVDHEPEQAA